MIIEDLIRLGKPLLESGLPPGDLLEIMTDLKEDKAKNFFRRVFVVEIPPEGSDALPAVMPVQVWGQEMPVAGKGNRVNFVPDYSLGLGAPFVLPTGGNPIHAQGKYVPVYPCWDRHLRGFSESSDAIVQFLTSRRARTPSLRLTEDEVAHVAEALHERVALLEIGERENALGILILARCDGDSALYSYDVEDTRPDLGASQVKHDRRIVADLDNLLDAWLAAKLEESAEVGKREGDCSICGASGSLVSSYCKAWPWALPEWNCPLPQGGNEKLWVEGVALDETCCQALTLGASVFSGLTRLIHPVVTHELFSPISDREGRNTASRRKLSDLPSIYGTAYVLPINDNSLIDDDLRETFVHGVQSMVNAPPKDGPLADRYMDGVTGFDVFLPEDVDTADYRLTLAYFHGDIGRGDVHLRAFIQDVIPSTMRKLRDIARKSAETAVSLLAMLSPGGSEKQAAYYRTIYRSIPYLLARGYGGSYLWERLETAVRRGQLDLGRATLNAARRMDSLVPRLPDSHFELNDEVIFFLTFREFVERYSTELAAEASHTIERRREMPMRPWKELLQLVAEGPVDSLCYESPEELGFAAGVLIRQFGRWYWSATKVGNEGKDFLKHRVLTFGSDLKPEVVWKRGLATMFDVEARYEKLHISDDFRRRVGVALAEFDRLQEKVRANRDNFMAAFWSGYALQGSGGARAPQEEG